MEPAKLIHADWLDILFENRNKSYGAYALRRDYPERLGLSLLFTILIPALLLWLMHSDPAATNLKDRIPEVRLYQMPSSVSTPPPSKPPSAPSARRVAAPLGSRIEVTDSLDRTVKPIPADSLIAAGAIPGSGPGSVPSGRLPGCGGVDSSRSAGPPTLPRPAGPLAVAEQMPSFPGGIEALRRFLEKNLVTPTELEGGQVVRVRVGFVVQEDGRVTDFTLQEDGGTVFNQEVFRVLRRMPAWVPGRSAGRPVAVQYHIPVVFTSSEP